MEQATKQKLADKNNPNKTYSRALDKFYHVFNSS